MPTAGYSYPPLCGWRGTDCNTPVLANGTLEQRFTEAVQQPFQPRVALL